MMKLKSLGRRRMKNQYFPVGYFNNLVRRAQRIATTLLVTGGITVMAVSMAHAGTETVDNLDPHPRTSFEGSWLESSAPNPYLGSSFFTKWDDYNSTFTWSPELLDGPGEYLVEVYWTHRPYRSRRVPYCIDDDSGGTCFELDQMNEELAATWTTLGQFNCTVAPCDITIYSTNGQASADAVRWTFIGGDAPAGNCVDALDWGTLFDNPEIAESYIDMGLRPVGDGISVGTDAGYFSSAYAVFELPKIDSPVRWGVLRMQIFSSGWTNPPDDPNMELALYDIDNDSLLTETLWTFDEYLATKNDIESGRRYGLFYVEEHSCCSGPIIEIPLSYDAIYDINAASGGQFAVGIAAGEGWAAEGSGVSFVKPTDGGIVQLEFFDHPGERVGSCEVAP
ncbi:MAG: hypothetical protein ACR2RD_03065 [Woeseiaceae bacterium]